jgi:hypothetical protein
MTGCCVGAEKLNVSMPINNAYVRNTTSRFSSGLDIRKNLERHAIGTIQAAGLDKKPGSFASPHLCTELRKNFIRRAGMPDR